VKKSITTLLTSGLLLFSGGAIAQSAEFLPELSPSLSSAVSALEVHGNVGSVELADLDRDGTPEVLVKLTTFVDHLHQDLLEWRVLDDLDGHAIQIGAWLGKDVRVVSTTIPSASRDELPGYMDVIYSDGSYWLAYGDTLKGYGSYTQRSLNRVFKPEVKDLEHFSEFGLQDINPEYVDAVQFTLEGSGKWLKVLSVAKSGYERDPDGASPYVVLDKEGNLVASGESFLFPLIFDFGENGFQIIDRVNFTYQMRLFDHGEG
jgi:hypothetical protein